MEGSAYERRYDWVEMHSIRNGISDFCDRLAYSADRYYSFIRDPLTKKSLPREVILANHRELWNRCEEEALYEDFTEEYNFNMKHGFHQSECLEHQIRGIKAEISYWCDCLCLPDSEYISLVADNRDVLSLNAIVLDLTARFDARPTQFSMPQEPPLTDINSSRHRISLYEISASIKKKFNGVFLGTLGGRDFKSVRTPLGYLCRVCHSVHSTSWSTITNRLAHDLTFPCEVPCENPWIDFYRSWRQIYARDYEIPRRKF